LDAIAPAAEALDQSVAPSTSGEIGEQGEERRRRRRRGGRNRNRREREGGEAMATAGEVEEGVEEGVVEETLFAETPSSDAETAPTSENRAETAPVIDFAAPHHAESKEIREPVVATVQDVTTSESASEAPLAPANIVPPEPAPVPVATQPVAEPQAVTEVVKAVETVSEPIAIAPMPVDNLREMLAVAGLTLAVTDPDKLRAAQDAAARIVPIPRVPRERKPLPPLSTEPLVQVETRH
jgi:ribonuclease E